MAIKLDKIDALSWRRQSGRNTILTRAGFEPPAEHQALTERLAAYKSLTTPVTDKLIEAIVSGTGDIESLRAAARAEHAESRLDDAVETAIANRLAEIVREGAQDAYKAVQRAFNDAADKFAKAVAVIDPETAAEDVIALGDLKKQQAWRDAADLAAELDRLLLPLAAAATNAGAHHPAENDSTGSRTPHTYAMVIGLTVDSTGVDNIRDIWDPWFDAEGRAHTWGALLKAGARIRAVDLADYAPARIPQRKLQRKVLREDQTYEFIEVDPESPDYVPVPNHETP